MSDPQREPMVDALASFLGIERERASAAMNHIWEATKDQTGPPPTWQPDMTDPAQALARRVQGAIEREFDGEPLFPAVVVVQDRMSNRIGMAATAIPLGEVDQLLLLGRGLARKAVRQHGGEPPSPPPSTL